MTGGAPPRPAALADGAAPTAYLFDLDGTLVDTAPDLRRALNRTLAGVGVAPVNMALTRHWVGHGVRAMLAAAFAHHREPVSTKRLDELQAVCIDHYAAGIAECSRPFPGVADTLPALAARAPLAVVTNKLRGLSESLLAALSLAGYFEFVIGRDTAAEPKPAAAPALLACERIGCAAAATLFVGDSETDVACARAAGCQVVVYRHGYNHGRDPETMGADSVIDSLTELL